MLMNGLYLIGGIACLSLGIYITIRQIKKTKTGEQDKLGFNYKLLAGGVGFIMVGFGLIAKS